MPWELVNNSNPSPREFDMTYQNSISYLGQRGKNY